MGNRICSTCRGTGTVKNLHNWAGGGKREQACWACYPEEAQAPSFQDQVSDWMKACFGPAISSDRVERNHRFLEEALELVQACGAPKSDAHALVEYVYGRPVGETWQEVGGVMTTLAALCLAQGLDMDEEARKGLAQNWERIDKIRAKQAAKPKGSPLPISMDAPVQADEIERHREGHKLSVVDLMDDYTEAETDEERKEIGAHIITMLAAPDEPHIKRQTEGGAVAVSQDVYWRYDQAPIGVDVFLLTEGGIGVRGQWREGGGFIGWHPLFKRDKTKENAR